VTGLRRASLGQQPNLVSPVFLEPAGQGAIVGHSPGVQVGLVAPDMDRNT